MPLVPNAQLEEGEYDQRLNFDKFGEKNVAPLHKLINTSGNGLS